MSKYGIIVNADDCVGCHACFVACKEENQVAPGVKWNHLERLEHPAEEVIEYFRVSCMHCENPACMKVCPVKPSTARCARIVLPKDACLPALKYARLRLCS